MAAMRVLVLFLAATAAEGARARALRHAQSGRMNPEAVAHTLAQVEDEWLQQAVAFAACNTSDASSTSCVEASMGEFVKSCKTVVSSIVEGASGDKGNIHDYLGDICAE